MNFFRPSALQVDLNYWINFYYQDSQLKSIIRAETLEAMVA